MREDLQEKLHHMFPRGFIMVYIQPNGGIAYHMFNPEEVEQIFNIEDGLKAAADEEE